MNLPLACFRCDLPGHGWAECDRPGAGTKQEYDQRVRDILIRWNAGSGFSTGIKAKIIQAECKAFEKARGK